ncbi:MAG: D-aminoacyl-tRNA deacylase [Planctomycetota bacterium]|jgi:D-tyrosyl-tRNA(Tyr) deacylase
MLAVVQRVTEASVSVASEAYEAAIGPGLCVLLGVEIGDGEPQAVWMARKLANLRIFRDEQDRMNRSVLDIGGEVLVVSQFTLAGDCTKGNRPSFVNAAEPTLGEALYERVCDELGAAHGLTVRRGVFGAMMQVALVNDGPVTIIVRREPATQEASPG